MRTAIFTKDSTTLTIETSEEMLNLVQLGREDDPVALSLGVNKVPVGPGVFKVFSNSPVRVTADPQELELAVTTDNKDGFPDPPLSVALAVDHTTMVQFFLDAKSQPVPR